MHSSLENFVSISPGFVPRAGVLSAGPGKFRFLQMGNLRKDGSISLASARCVDLLASQVERYLLRSGDIVLINRGADMRAGIIDDGIIDVIASAHFLILRPATDIFLPGFIAWFLNHKKGQTHLQKHAKGSAIPMITREALGKLPVPILAREDQSRILKLADCVRQRRALLDRLDRKLEQLIMELPFKESKNASGEVT